MEQKQLDELNDYSEEFVEDETPEEHMVLKAKHERKALALKRIAEKSAKELAAKEALAKVSVKSGKAKTPEVKMDPIKVETYTDEEMTISSAKEELKEVKSIKTSGLDITSPVNPWAEEKSKPASDNESFFKDASTWQAFTGILIILLIFAVFTQGFRFTKETPLQTLSLNDAQAKALTYVNTKLLQPPFTAVAKKTIDVGNFYKVTLSVAGQDVDSYVTKDGKLFFPQGFDLTASDNSVSKSVSDTSKADPKSASSSTSNIKDSSASKTTSTTSKTTNVSSTAATKPASTSTPPISTQGTAPSTSTSTQAQASTSSPTSTSSTSTTSVKTYPHQVSLGAKKWFFSSDKIIVKQNDHVILTLRPENIAFTFAIKDLGVQKEISGPTTIEFDALTKGTFTYTCSSCEDWRGMSGTLVVE